MRDAFVKELIKIAEADKRVWLLTGDLGFKVLEEFAESYSDRFVNVGVAEQNMIGVAAGIAMAGNIPYVYSLGNFPVMRCLEQIRNDVCYHNLPVRIVALGGGLTYGSLGYTHHSVEDLAVMTSMPGLKVIAPGDPFEASAATRALAAMPGPAYLRLGRAGETYVHSAPPDFSVGQAITVRDGTDCSIIATGAVLAVAAAAADLIAKKGISVRLISMHTLSPLDQGAIRYAATTKTVITLEEHGPGGLASLVAEVLVGTDVCFRPMHLQAGAQMITDTQSGLRARENLTPEAIVENLLSILNQT